MPVNTEAIKRKMSAKGITARDMAQALGIDESTYYRRMANHGIKFTVWEAQKIAEILNLSNKEATHIFLSGN